MKEITLIVADFYGCWHKLVFSKSRKRKYVKVRQVAMFIIRELYGLTYEEIAEFFNRDHSLVVHSIKTLKKDIATDEIYRYEVFSLLDKVKAADIYLVSKKTFCNTVEFKKV